MAMGLADHDIWNCSQASDLVAGRLSIERPDAQLQRD